MKKRVLALLFPLALGTVFQFVQNSQGASAEAPVTVVTISAKKFAYTPNQITLKKGVPAILRLSTEDRSHGFSIPAFNQRADIVPGKVTDLKVTPSAAGDFDFYCDIFCGSGHDDMGGKIKVVN